MHIWTIFVFIFHVLNPLTAKNNSSSIVIRLAMSIVLRQNKSVSIDSIPGSILVTIVRIIWLKSRFNPFKCSCMPSEASGRILYPIFLQGYPRRWPFVTCPEGGHGSPSKCYLRCKCWSKRRSRSRSRSCTPLAVHQPQITQSTTSVSCSLLSTLPDAPTGDKEGWKWIERNIGKQLVFIR